MVKAKTDKTLQYQWTEPEGVSADSVVVHRCLTLWSHQVVINQTSIFTLDLDFY